MDVVTLAMAKSYTDSQRLGYSEPTQKVIVPETTFTDRFNFTSQGITLERLQKGETYTVVWDGVEYECVCKLIESTGTSNLFLGNYYGVAGIGPESDEPFLYMDATRSSGAIMQSLAAVDKGTHTVSIYYDTETVHPINPKYLPEGGVGYSEYETVFSETAIEKDSTADIYIIPMDKQLKEGNSYVVTIDGVSYEVVCGNNESSGYLYLGNLANRDDTKEDTGEPFLVTQDYSNELWITLATEMPESITFALKEEVDHPIYAKYLPGGVPAVDVAVVGQTLVVKEVDENSRPTKWETGGIPVITLETPMKYLGTLQPLSENDNAKFEALANASQSVVILTFVQEGDPTSPVNTILNSQYVPGSETEEPTYYFMLCGLNEIVTIQRVKIAEGQYWWAFSWDKM